MDDLAKIVETNDITEKGFYVYKGMSKKEKRLMYIGTTTQVPRHRFRWQKANNKDLVFEVIRICKDQNEMLDEEFRLIQKYRPTFNIITKRKQNLNIKLTPEILESRKGVEEWCQSCLKRRVNSGYKLCLFCS